VRDLPGRRGGRAAKLLGTVGPRREGPGAPTPLDALDADRLDNALTPGERLDHDNQIVHTFGDVSPLLRLPRGQP